MKMEKLRFICVGAGFWAKYQLAAWQDRDDVECVAVCDRDGERARALAHSAGVRSHSTDYSAVLESAKPDFVDIVTGPETHRDLTLIAAAMGCHVVCQKPMAPSLEHCREMVEGCKEAGVRLLIHENWRWQYPIRQAKRIVDSGRLGQLYRARISFATGMDILTNQPALAEAEEYILSDMGSHLFDVARFFFGEASSIYARANRVHQHIRGEDAAVAVLDMGGVSVVCEMAEAETPLEYDQGDTCLFIEGSLGSLELTHHRRLKLTTQEGTQSWSVTPPSYAWAHPDYALFQGAMVPCLEDIVLGLQGGESENEGSKNLKTMELVHAAYRSTRTGEVVRL
jgi:predicted dehydrogenase